MPHTISVITDEVSPDLEQGIAFALEHGLSTVDVRSIGGVNFLSLDRAAQKQAAAQIDRAGLTVGCLATPLLKWPPPDRSSQAPGDQFGFDRKGRTDRQLYVDAFEAAALLGTPNLRIFSLLTYDGFAVRDLRPHIEPLLELAGQHDAVLHIENEPVCNIRSVADLGRVMQEWTDPRLRALLDIGNAWWTGARPSHAELLAVMPRVTLMHIKDFSTSGQRVVPCGEGDIPFVDNLRACIGATKGRALTFSVETHVPAEPAAATKRSLAGLRRCLAQVGAAA